MRTFWLLTFVVLAASCAEGQHPETKDLAFFANNFQLLSETRTEGPALSARVFKVREFGECDNNNCPNEYVYIAISEFGEYPKQALHISKGAADWQFLGWERAIQPTNNDQVVFKLKSKTADKEQRFTVRAGLDKFEFVGER